MARRSDTEVPIGDGLYGERPGSEGAPISRRSHAEAAAKPPADGGRIGSVEEKSVAVLGVELERVCMVRM
jgi:hypothetical protein